MLLVDDLAAGGTKNLRHTPRGLVTLIDAIVKIEPINYPKNPVLYMTSVTLILMDVM